MTVRILIRRAVLLILCSCVAHQTAEGEMVAAPGYTIKLFAGGDGGYGYTGDNGPALNATFEEIRWLAVDRAGNVYEADQHRIRMINPNGTVTTVAGGGNGYLSYSGTPMPATGVSLYLPGSPTPDAAGGLYFTEFPGIYRVANRMVTIVAGAGDQGGDYTGPVANAGMTPHALALDAAGNLYLADGCAIRKISGGMISTVVGGVGRCGYGGDNGPAVSATLAGGNAIDFDGAGNMYILDHYRVRKVSNGVITTVAGNGKQAFSGDGGPATNASFLSATDLKADAAGNLYIVDYAGGEVRKVSNGVITGIATSVGDLPGYIALDPGSGKIYITEGNRIWLLTPASQADPTLTSLNPSSGTAGSAALTLTVTGTGFVAGAVVKWAQNGQVTNLTTQLVSSTTLTAQIPANLLANSGTAQITVANPTGNPTPASTFTITPPALGGPQITGLVPASVVAGSAGFTLLVNGAGFADQDVVRWNGVALPTMFVSAGQLSATVSANLIAASGSAVITVYRAGGMLVSGSGTFKDIVTTALSAANQSWAFSFLVDTQPVVTYSAAGFEFDAPARAFQYKLANQAVAQAPKTVHWMNSKGLTSPGFQACGGITLILPSGSFQFSNPPGCQQFYTGTEASPIIQAGTYPVSAPAFSIINSAGFTGSPYDINSGPIAIAPQAATTSNSVTLTITPAAQPSGLTISGRATTANLVTDNRGNADFCATPVTKTAFLTTDDSVGVWFTFDRGRPGDVLLVQWIHPTGAPDAGQPTVTLDYTGSGCYAWFMGIKGQAPASEPGTWAVRLAVNGIVAFTLPFSITNPAPITSPTPVVRGVTSAYAFGGASAITPGSWVEIYGTNLAVNERGWYGGDFNGSRAPTSLDGTSVTIGGQPAFVSYISGGQVNVLAPSSVGAGPQPLVVTTPAGTSAGFTVTVNATQPALFAPSFLNIGGVQYLGATFADGVTWVAPPGALPGLTSRRAKANDVIILYGMGFGQVTPYTPVGQYPAAGTSLALPFQMSVGQIRATLQYFGLAPSLIGLYQFNVVVPPVAASDRVPVTFTLNGVSGTQTLYIAVQ